MSTSRQEKSFLLKSATSVLLKFIGFIRRPSSGDARIEAVDAQDFLHELALLYRKQGDIIRAKSVMRRLLDNTKDNPGLPGRLRTNIRENYDQLHEIA